MIDSHNSEAFFLLYADTKNKLYLFFHTALRALGVALVRVFLPVILFVEMQQPLWAVFSFFAIYSLVTLLLLPAAVWLISRFGSKLALVGGILFMIPYLFLISQIATYPSLIFIIPVIGGIYEALFWPAFHFDMCHIAKQKNSGKRIALLNIVVITMTAIAPFIGGLIASYISPGLIFWIGSAFVFLSMIPLALSPQKHKPLPFSLGDAWQRSQTVKCNKGIFSSFFGGCIVTTIGGTVWPLIMYLHVEEYAKLGAVTAATTLLIVGLLHLVGKKLDKTTGNQSAVGAISLQSIAWVGTLVAFFGSWLSIIVITILDAIRRMGSSIIWMSMDHAVYVHAAHHLKNPLYTIFIRQVGINIAISLMNIVLALIFFYQPDTKYLAYTVIAAIIFAPLQGMIFKYDKKVKTEVLDEIQELGDASQV